MANGIYKVTEDFEKALAEYTNAKYVVTVDNMSNALFLALYYENYINKSIKGGYVKCPKRTYPSVPCEIIHAGLQVNFTENYGCLDMEQGTLTGAYKLENSNVYDSALSFTADMY